ncbi:MAG: 3',5'-cyclic-nucleotide phosphodiesterase [Deltaproteobacteria bacterium]
MKIRVLGCHGSQLPHRNTTSFLIEKNVLMDAGSVTPVLTLEEQLRIDYIFITHAHLDHVRDIMFLADNLYYAKRERPLIVCSSRGIIETIHRHLFNNVIWPDFSRIPSVKAPLIKFEILTPGRTKVLGNWRVRAVGVHHTVETMGFLMESKGKKVLFLGDTGPTEDVWKVAGNTKGLKAIFIETSLPGGMQNIADRTGHLTPVTLAAELKKMDNVTPEIYLHHMKPQYAEEIRREVVALQDKKIHIIEDGQVIQI